MGVQPPFRTMQEKIIKKTNSCSVELGTDFAERFRFRPLLAFFSRHVELLLMVARSVVVMATPMWLIVVWWKEISVYSKNGLDAYVPSRKINSNHFLGKQNLCLQFDICPGYFDSLIQLGLFGKGRAIVTRTFSIGKIIR